MQDAYVCPGQIELSVSIPGDVKLLRVDPSMDSCIVKIKEAVFNGERLPVENHRVMVVNGKVWKSSDPSQTGPSIVFATKDPNMNLKLEGLQRQPVDQLTMKLEVVRLPMEIAEDMVAGGKKLIR